MRGWCFLVIKWYIITAVLSVLFSFIIEKTADCIIKNKRFTVRENLAIKRFLIILVINIAVWVLCLNRYSLTPQTVIACLFFDIAFCMAIVDLYTKKISTAFIISLFVLSVAFVLVQKDNPWYSHIFGCGLGFIPLFCIRYFAGIKAKQEALGSADVYIGGISGLFLGFEKFLLAGLTSALSALIFVEIVKRIKGYDKTHRYAFSPFLVFGFTLSLLFGDLILQRYYDLIFSIVL